MTERLEIATPSGPAWLDVDRPTGRARAVLMIGHGAGGSVDAPDIVAVRDAVLTRKVAVVRVTQPYRVAGRRAPAPPKRLDEAWLAAAAAVRAQQGLGTLPLVSAGRSSGARVACRTAEMIGAGAVVALAFPLHPPGRPEQTRLLELELPSVPVLVVQGERDAFGRPPVGAGREIVVVPGDHSLKKDTDAVAQAVVTFLGETVLRR